MIFLGTYPKAWCLAKFFTIFKKGLSCIPGNYSGISILNLCKLYDGILNKCQIAKYGVDGFLELLHCLLLMDDTVIFATSKTTMQRKPSLLMEATNQTNMTMHPTKSKYFAVNTGDREPFILGNVVISYQYFYCLFTTTRIIFYHEETSSQPCCYQAVSYKKV